MVKLIVENDIMLTQPNSITRAHYDMSSNQKDILSKALGHLNTNEVQPKGEWIIFDLKELYSETPSKSRIDKYITVMKEELHDLFHNKNVLTLQLPNGKWKECVWLTDIEHDDNNSEIKIKLGDTIAKIFSQIEGNYTQLFLKNTFNLKSYYSKRLYELAMQDKPNYREMPLISINELRKILGIENKYKVFAELKRSIIDKAVNDINKNTDIEIDYVFIKKGKEIVKIKFSYKFKSEKHLQSYKTDRKNKWKPREKNSLEQIKKRDLQTANKTVLELKTILGN